MFKIDILGKDKAMHYYLDTNWYQNLSFLIEDIGNIKIWMQ